MSLRLTLTSYREQPPEEPLSVVFGRDGGTVGRSAENQMVLPGESVSRKHAEIRYEEGAYILHDNSTNGTQLITRNKYLQGDSIELVNGDQLKIGDYELLVSLTVEGGRELEAFAPLSHEDIAASREFQEEDDWAGIVSVPFDQEGRPQEPVRRSRFPSSQPAPRDPVSIARDESSLNDRFAPPEIKQPPKPPSFLDGEFDVDDLFKDEDSDSGDLLGKMDLGKLPPAEQPRPAPPRTPAYEQAPPREQEPPRQPEAPRERPVEPAPPVEPERPAERVPREVMPPPVEEAPAVRRTLQEERPSQVEQAPPVDYAPPVEPAPPPREAPPVEPRPPARDIPDSTDPLAAFDVPVASEPPPAVSMDAQRPAEVERPPSTDPHAEPEPLEGPPPGSIPMPGRRAAPEATPAAGPTPRSDSQHRIVIGAAPAGESPAAPPQPGATQAAMPSAPEPRPAGKPIHVSPEDAKALLDLFLEGAGIDDPEFAKPEEAAVLMKMAGAVFREMVHGLWTVLRGRMEFKSEFRLSMTMIRPIDNNPFKFSPRVEDTLKLLLKKGHPGFLEGVEAAKEGFDDVMNDQLALNAGIQASLMKILKRFDPKEFAAKYEGRRVLMKSGKCWEDYSNAYGKLADEAVDNFFGEAFARAYEEQLAKLRGKRNTD